MARATVWNRLNPASAVDRSESLPQFQATAVSGRPPTYAVIAPLGLGAFADHAVITTVLLGPTVGFGLLSFPLLVLGYRSRTERQGTFGVGY